MWRLAVCVLLGWSLTACEDAMVTTTRGHRIARDDLREVILGRTTPPEIERRFGPAEQRDADGALRYGYTLARRHLIRIAGWDVPFPATKDVERREVVFRFQRGVLSRICRSRHAVAADAAADVRRPHPDAPLS